MLLRTRQRLVWMLLAVVTGVAPSYAQAPAEARTDFARLILSLSEEGGTFQMENLVSNEKAYPHAVEGLQRLGVTGGAYVGVGPEQNFHYIARTRPEWAFILDIRRENTLHHLLYKALFQLGESPLGFLSLLFSRQPGAAPEGLDAKESMIACMDQAPPNEELFQQNLRFVFELIQDDYGFPLTEKDRQTVEHIYRAFFQEGLNLRCEYPKPARENSVTLRDLLRAKDCDGRCQHFLASPEHFAFLKGLHARNRIVPVTGDFAGPKALRAVGAFIREQGSHVSVFYLSNVEQYLKKERYAAFAENVRSLPLTEQSLLIRSQGGKQFKSHPMCHVEGASLLALQRTLSFLKHYDAGDYWTHADLVQVDYLDWTREGR